MNGGLFIEILGIDGRKTLGMAQQGLDFWKQSTNLTCGDRGGSMLVK